jgi:hypothetical protein
LLPPLARGAAGGEANATVGVTNERSRHRNVVANSSKYGTQYRTTNPRGHYGGSSVNNANGRSSFLKNQAKKRQPAPDPVAMRKHYKHRHGQVGKFNASTLGSDFTSSSSNKAHAAHARVSKYMSPYSQQRNVAGGGGSWRR